MIKNVSLTEITIGKDSIEIFIPDPEHVKKQYQKQALIDPKIPFPYWSQIWHSAIAMAQFIQEQPYFITNKKVLELAAGLGLPSFVAARVAKEVVCTDYLPEAVSVIKKSIKHHKYSNISCGLLDWNKMPNPFPEADVVLMSDVNYATKDFETIHSLLRNFLKQGSIIILTTPQRLLAKPFIDQLMPWCKLKEEVEVNHLATDVTITVLVLKLNITP